MIPTFVIPFYGEGIGGGAETQCRRLAENLVLRGVRAEVLTTTIESLAANWSAGAHDPGVYEINGVTVRRFTPAEIDGHRFNEVNHKLVRGEKLTPFEELVYVENAVNSASMYEFIGDNQKNRIYFFIPYLFGISLLGSAAAPEKAVLIPCLHDEGYAYMDITHDMFDRVLAVHFNSKAEMRLAEEIYDGLKHTEAILMGEGVDTITGADADRFRTARSLGDDPFILYVGRRDKTKNTPLLVDYFAQYHQKYPDSKLKLVLIGSGKIPVPDAIAKDVLDLGFVSLEEKSDAHAAATMLCQPSLMESFSLVIMDSWRCGRPNLVHSGCCATRDHVTDSGGGFAFGSFPEFAEQVKSLIDDPKLANSMGEKGRKYVEQNYSWDVICRNFSAFVKAASGSKQP